jgi:hypothetical protein
MIRQDCRFRACITSVTKTRGQGKLQSFTQAGLAAPIRPIEYNNSLLEVEWLGVPKSPKWANRLPFKCGYLIMQ